MSQVIKVKSLWKWLIVYLGTILIGYILFAAVWGGVNGAFIATRFAADPVIQDELEKIFPTDLSNFRKLPEEKRRAVLAVTEENFKRWAKEVNWLPIHLMVNIITFAVLGMLSGLILRDFRFSILIPAGLLFITLPILRAEEFRVVSKALTIFIGLLTQILSVYSFSSLACYIRKKCSKREIVNSRCAQK